MVTAAPTDTERSLDGRSFIVPSRSTCISLININILHIIQGGGGLQKQCSVKNVFCQYLYAI